MSNLKSTQLLVYTKIFTGSGSEVLQSCSLAVLQSIPQKKYHITPFSFLLSPYSLLITPYSLLPTPYSSLTAHLSLLPCYYPHWTK
jgi:hypothetical protein